MQTPTLRPSQPTWPVSPLVGCCHPHPHPPSPFIIITQPIRLWPLNQYVCVCVRACRMLPSCWCTWNFLTSISGYTRPSCVLPTRCCDASSLSDSLCFSLDRSRPAVTSAAARFTSASPGTRKRHIGVTGWDLPGQIFTSQPSVTCRMFNGRNSVIFGKLFFPENQRV